ncbi:MAG: Integrase core domain protein [Synergistetes bacterium ADurb.Bin155]|nr:MAG: Integrase core domain protein [Synergistetes bacterium ADurb.Bin155]
MERFGQMLQIDASPFDWLSNGSMITLHGAIDDATGSVTALRFERTECLDGYFHVLEETILSYGIPRSLYSDAHSIFFSPSPSKLSLTEELRGAGEGRTQFGKALEILGINPIKALSPQAKGRIERLWGTLQHRLVVDLRVAGVSTPEEANAFLASYRTRHNDLFAVPPKDEATAFVPAPSKEDLALILCRRAFRKVTGDSTVSWKGRKWSALDSQGRKVLFRKGVEVEVLDLLDGRTVLHRQGAFHELVRVEEGAEKKTPKGANAATSSTGERVRKPWTPRPDHPWKREYERMASRKRIREHSLEQIPWRG